MSIVKEFYAEKLNVRIYETREEMGKTAAEMASGKIIQLLSKKSEINMIFAAAPSQNEIIAGLLESSEIDWSRINAYHMDEYIGLSDSSPQGFGNFLRERIFSKAPFKSVNFLNGNASDIDEECKRYSELLKTNPIDVTCAGIGENGHLAFNDPSVADFNDEKLVKVVDLEEVCRQQQVNDGCFSEIDDVPKQALTLTIPALISSDYIFCVVPSKTKAQAVYDTINNEISINCPATILKTHKNAILFTDKDSAKLILY